MVVSIQSLFQLPMFCGQNEKCAYNVETYIYKGNGGRRREKDGKMEGEAKGRERGEGEKGKKRSGGGERREEEGPEGGEREEHRETAAEQEREEKKEGETGSLRFCAGSPRASMRAGGDNGIHGDRSKKHIL